MVSPESSTARVRGPLRVMLFALLSPVYLPYWYYVARSQVDAEMQDERSIRLHPGFQIGIPILVGIVSFVGLLSDSLAGGILGVAGLIITYFIFLYFQFGFYKDVNRLQVRAKLPEFPFAWYVFLPLLFFAAGSLSLVLFGVETAFNFEDSQANSGVIASLLYYVGIVGSIGAYLFPLVFFVAVIERLNQYWSATRRGNQASYSPGELIAVIAGGLVLLVVFALAFSAVQELETNPGPTPASEYNFR